MAATAPAAGDRAPSHEAEVKAASLLRQFEAPWPSHALAANIDDFVIQYVTYVSSVLSAP